MNDQRHPDSDEERADTQRSDEQRSDEPRDDGPGSGGAPESASHIVVASAVYPQKLPLIPLPSRPMFPKTGA